MLCTDLVTSDSIMWDEQLSYCSFRFDIASTEIITYPASDLQEDTIMITYLVDWKKYELTNHFGDVLVSVNDKKTGFSSYIGYWFSGILSMSNYSPFGW